MDDGIVLRAEVFGGRDEAIAKALGGLLHQVRSGCIDQAGGDRARLRPANPHARATALLA